MTQPHVAIAGAGVIGLFIALLLSEVGYKVIIVARNLPGDKSTEWASPWAGALLAPHPDIGFPELQTASLRVYKNLTKGEPASGVKDIKITEFFNDRPEDAEIYQSELPPNVTLGFSYDGVVVNPNQFLPWLVQKLRNGGVSFTCRTLESMEELVKLTGVETLVNAPGLGAERLAPGENVFGIRGQTMFVKTDKLDEAMIIQGSKYTYVIPRPSDGDFILGGVTQPGDKRIQPELDLQADILRQVNTMTNEAFSWVDIKHDVVKDIVGFQPSRRGGLREERRGNIIHAYGLSSLGYLYAFGVAEKVRDLMRIPIIAKL
ncbi:putative FAD dependent oxidoreductase [Ilyonectria destructans]|nr:putative FAD dependent oxidoreductase [Ilyonectria destructans]